MADSARYKTIMYDLFWLGKEPVFTPEEQERAAKSGKKTGPRAPTKHELDALEALRAKASQLRAESAK